MSLEHFETKRLSVRDWRYELSDQRLRQSLEADLSDILTDPVLAHLPPPLQLNRDGVAGWIEDRANESDVILVRWKDGSELIGLMILASLPDGVDRPTVHIGYLLAEKVWGKGVASELVAGFVSAMDQKVPVRLIGGVDRGNPASARVLQKAGFKADPNASHSGNDMYVLDLG